MGALKIKETEKATGKKSWGHKIAANRGERWRKNMIKGRQEAQRRPSFIRLFRVRKGLNQSDIAKKLGVSPSTFGWIERGKQPVKKDKAEQIAQYLGTSVQKIFKFSGKKKYVALISEPFV